MICLFSTSFSHGSNLSNLVRILFKLRDKLSHTASPRHGSGGISPVAAYRSEQPGAVCQGCISTAVYRRPAFDWRPRLFYFLAAWREYILRSTLSQDWKRAGGLGWIWTEVYLWTLPTVPMSAWWKRFRIKIYPLRRRHRKERLVRGVLIGEGSAACFAIGSTSKSGADVWTFSPKKRPVCKGFQPRLLRG